MTAPDPTDEAVHPHGLLPLIVLLAGTFMAALDVFIVNVAVPSIGRDLQASSSSIEWVVAGYSLPYGVGLVTGARLGDILGRRRMFLLSITVFTLASLACGCSPTAEVLIAGRVVQGISAAALGPQVLATITATYAGRARARALDAFAATLGAAAVLGQLIGGGLIRLNLFGWDWRTCFLVNVPIGLAVVLVGVRALPESARVGRRLDWWGTALVGTALTLVVLPLIEGREQGWPWWSWTCLVAGAVLLALFVTHQAVTGHRGGSPLVDLRLFGDRAFSVGLAVQFIFWMGQAAFFLVFALYCQDGLGRSPLQSGLLFLPLGAGYLLTSTTARHLAARWGRQVIAVGAATMLLGEVLLVLAVAHTHGGHVGWLVGPLLVHGLGMGLALGPLVATVLARVAPRNAGAASGLLATGQQIGNAVGVAIIGVVFYAVAGATGSGSGTAFKHGLSYLMVVALAVVALVQLLPARAATQSN